MVQTPHKVFGLWGQRYQRKKAKEKPLKLNPAPIPAKIENTYQNIIPRVMAKISATLRR